MKFTKKFAKHHYNKLIVSKSIISLFLTIILLCSLIYFVYNSQFTKKKDSVRQSIDDDNYIIQKKEISIVIKKNDNLSILYDHGFDKDGSFSQP
jgi:predicted amino acid-binding ACT domain protein